MSMLMQQHPPGSGDTRPARAPFRKQLSIHHPPPEEDQIQRLDPAILDEQTPSPASERKFTLGRPFPISTSSSSRRSSRASHLAPVASVENYDSMPAIQERKKRKTRLRRTGRMFKKIWKKLGLKHFISIFIVVIYTFIGAGLFQALEYGTDVDAKAEAYESYLKTRTDFDKRIREMLKDKVNSSVTERHIVELLDWYEQQMEISPSTEPTWDFWTAMYFAGTLYTTIGYGNVACSTTLGQLITIIYALVGIPLVLSALNDLGQWLFKTINKAMVSWERFKRYIFYKWQVRKNQREKDKLAKDECNVDYDLIETKVVPKDSIQGSEDMENVDKKTEPSGTVDDEEDDIDVEELLEEEPEVKIPVLVALTVTLSWIFMCAGLFCIWEDWSYWKSIYFFFISLSTIGLGDVTPDYPSYMVMSYGFVIIGLSLVSMCINVVQNAIEDLYVKLLMAILSDYTQKMAQGSDQVNASVGMMQVWNNNPKAKYLMPLLSKQKKATAMKKFQAEAKEQGLELPPVLTQIDPNSGLPAILTVSKSKDKDEDGNRQPIEQMVQQAIQKAETEVLEQAAPPTPPPPSPKVIQYETHTQTVIPQLEDKQEQTHHAEFVEIATQTDSSTWSTQDEFAQTVYYELIDCEQQTTPTDQIEVESQTTTIQTINSDSQTHVIQMHEQELQTHLYDLKENEQQTEPPETSDNQVQTAEPDCNEQITQTEIDVRDREIQTEAEPEPEFEEEEEIVVPKKNQALSAAKRRMLRVRSLFSRAKKKRRTLPVQKLIPETIEEEEEEDEDESSKESLNWDPVDGLHAEKQKAVGDLKKMFEFGQQQQSASQPISRTSSFMEKSLKPEQIKRADTTAKSRASPLLTPGSLRRQRRTSTPSTDDSKRASASPRMSKKDITRKSTGDVSEEPKQKTEKKHHSKKQETTGDVSDGNHTTEKKHLSKKAEKQ